jgi:hypothetical protein
MLLWAMPSLAADEAVQAGVATMHRSIGATIDGDAAQ